MRESSFILMTCHHPQRPRAQLSPVSVAVWSLPVHMYSASNSRDNPCVRPRSEYVCLNVFGQFRPCAALTGARFLALPSVCHSQARISVTRQSLLPDQQLLPQLLVNSQPCLLGVPGGSSSLSDGLELLNQPETSPRSLLLSLCVTRTGHK